MANWSNADRLRQAKEDFGLSNGDIAEIMTARGMPTSKQTVTSWLARPDALSYRVGPSNLKYKAIKDWCDEQRKPSGD